MANSYKNSGVDIEAGDETVKRIKNYAKYTFNKNVISEIGLFGGFFEFDKDKYKNPVLVSSVDGVGTKLKIAFEMDKHDTVGQDLVNHCVNDIAVCGAKPLFFLDYLAFGKLFPEKAEQIISGFSKACIENGCALIGGETAEMPGLYTENEYDMSGTIVGVVEKDKALNGKKIERGNLLIGFKSTGLHTNGYSLARTVLFPKYKVDQFFKELNSTLGEALLQVHKSYLNLITSLLNKYDIKGLSHITGGGIVGNTKRILHSDFVLDINWNSWEVPALFKIIQNAGEISDDEMRKVFNLGIGLIAVVEKNDAHAIIEFAKTLGEEPIIIGEIK